MKNRRALVLLLVGAILGAAGTLVAIYWLVPPSAMAITSALETTRIPSLSFVKTPYDDAAREVVKRLQASRPDVRGVRLKIERPALSVPDSTITGDFSNLTARQILNQVSAAGGRLCEVGDGAIELALPSFCSPPPPLTAREEFMEGIRSLFH